LKARYSIGVESVKDTYNGQYVPKYTRNGIIKKDVSYSHIENIRKEKYYGVRNRNY
jgi:hypothetical protein